MNLFESYFHLGIEHILDTKGYDHILFVLTLCSVYIIQDWKKILILVTAFTAGHSLTLALSSLNIISVKASIIELLIPVTIILTAWYNINVVRRKKFESGNIQWNYLIALGFGFIHGMGFSNFFKAILGNEESVTMPLFAFNLGVEAGQIAIVGIYFILLFLIVELAGLKRHIWTTVISGTAIIIAFKLIFNQL